jgi:phosphoribosylanthranilate isomerase
VPPSCSYPGGLVSDGIYVEISGMRVRVKICGITSLSDARAAVKAGADALGFVFSEASPRFIRPEAAAAITHHLPGRILRVGVFVDAPQEAILRAVATCRLDAVQLHGDESPEFCDALVPVQVWKAFRVRDRDALVRLPAYRDATAAWLLDSYTRGQAGGTGTAFAWEIAVEARMLGHPIVLAGGLTPENVADAVRLVQPAGVDVSSGVEASPGKKDPAKVRAFIDAVRSSALP